ncbi:methyltransferase domain-containing protein [Nitrospira sp. Kam-Ns4a]
METYSPGYSEAAIRYMRRRHAARDAAFLLPRLKPGMTLLDCGCGPGTITVGLAEAVAPGLVVGVDVAPSQVALAEATAAARGLTNVRFEAANVYRLPFSDGTFDVVFAHALFEHLSEPLAALEELRRVLRPGGLVALASPDWGGNLMAPAEPDVARALDVFKAIQTRNGGNPYVGRECGRLLERAGFADIRLTAMYDCYEEVPLVAELLAQRIEEAVGRQAVAGLGLGRDEVGALCRALRQWAAQPTILFAQAYVEAIGVRPE